MKYFFLLSVILLGCTNTEKTKEVELAVLIDLTEIEDTNSIIDVDSFLLHEIKTELGISENEKFNDFGTVSLFQLYDFSSTRPEIVKCLEPSGINQSKVQREDDVNVFLSKLKISLNKCLSHPTLNEETQEFKQSFILEPLKDVLADLQKSKCSLKKVILFSDMLENSSNFSFYGEVKTKKEIIAIIDEKLSSIDLSNIELKIVFTPNKEKDSYQRFAKECWIEYFNLNKPKEFRYSTYLKK